MDKLAGRSALVTGASKGIGAAIAAALASEGAAVGVHFGSDSENAAGVVDRILGGGGRAIAVRGNVAEASDVKRILGELVEAFGGLDILVNNAAAYDMAALEEVTEAEFRRHFDTNVLGAILLAREALRHFRPGACVINISSAIVLAPAPQTLLYSSSKAALNMVTEVLARELGPRGIRVNTLAPGVTQTERHRVSEWDEAIVGQIVDRTSLGRIGLPRDIAPAAVFLASDDAHWVTGTTLYVSGGYH